MRVLWVVNVKLPELSNILSEKPQPYGGWLINTSIELAKLNNFELAIAFPNGREDGFNKYIGEQITYYGFQNTDKVFFNNLKDHEIFFGIIEDFKPDLVHIFGTEYPHTLSMVNACEKNGINCVVSIQGLISQVARYLYSDLPNHVIFGTTIRNLIKGDSVFGQKKKFIQRGKFEVEALRKAKNVIGRTTWDKSCVTEINPTISYFHCNETLRESFYEEKWSYDNCEKYSVFLSQGQYPIKGLHYVIDALSIVIREYPNVKLYIGGKNIISNDSLTEKLKISYYGKYIKDKIEKLQLRDSIIFTGTLEENEMVSIYMRSNVFICPSSIENSPNSLGEAMLLGVPCIASYVGGIPDLLQHKEEGFLYQHNDPVLLAHYIKEIFKDNELVTRLSENARKRASFTHDKEKNLNDLIDIYLKIGKSK